MSLADLPASPEVHHEGAQGHRVRSGYVVVLILLPSVATVCTYDDRLGGG